MIQKYPSMINNKTLKLHFNQYIFYILYIFYYLISQSLCEIFIDKGSILVKLKPIKCEKIILRMRTCLCEWQQLTTNTRRLLLKVFF